MSLHPAAVLTLWAGAAVFLQSLAAPAFWWGALAAAVLAALGAPARFWRLLRRIRILLLVSLLLFAWATPGVRVAPGWPWLTLTWDGLWLGLEHATRLVVMVALVAWLLERMSVSRLVCALHALLAPLSPLGVAAERIAVRLSLVLDAVGEPGGAWRVWFLQAEMGGGVSHVRLEAQAWRAVDRLSVAAVLVGLVLWGLA
jgi:energy-coupling factor transporter transmembrane protein EcfT